MTRIARRDLQPDPHHPRIPDTLTREFYRRSFTSLTHTDITVGAEVFTRALEPQRVRSVTLCADPGSMGSIFTDLLIDGVSIITTGMAPESGGGTVYVKPHPIFQAGTTITSSISIDGGATGPIQVTIEFDSFIVAPRESVRLEGRDRLFPSRRREVARINETIGRQRAVATLRRAQGRRAQETDPDQIKRIDHRFRPRRPR